MWVEEMQSFKDIENIYLERWGGTKKNGVTKVKDWFLERAWTNFLDDEFRAYNLRKPHIWRDIPSTVTQFYWFKYNILSVTASEVIIPSGGSMDMGTRLLGCKSWLCHLLTLWLWTCHLSILSVSSKLKMEMMIIILNSRYDHED